MSVEKMKWDLRDSCAWRTFLNEVVKEGVFDVQRFQGECSREKGQCV